MNVQFINNGGGGFAESVEIPENTTVKAFFETYMPKEHEEEELNAKDYLIRVNRDISPDTRILEEGDRVTITPTKIEGA